MITTSMSKTIKEKQAKSELKISFLSLEADLKPVAPADQGGSFNEKPAEQSAPDPYEEFLKGQRKREATWHAERAAKNAGVNSPPVETIQRGTCQKTVELDKVKKTDNVKGRETRISENDEVGQLERQLEEKNQALDTMKKRVEKLEESNRLAAGRYLHEDFCKVSYECTTWATITLLAPMIVIESLNGQLSLN